jgi:hypothetical protein
VRFSGDRLYVNANTAGAELRVELLDEALQPIPGFTFDDCRGYVGNSTCAPLIWGESPSLGALGGRPVRLRFRMDRGDFYAFWVTDSPSGESHGYHAAGRVT